MALLSLIVSRRSRVMNKTMQCHSNIEMGSMRTFFAITLDQEFDPGLNHIIDQFKAAPELEQVIWHPLRKLHITLRFFGETPVSKLNEILQASAAAVKDLQPFNVSFSKPFLFPPQHKPKVIALGVEAESTLQELVHRLDLAATDCGFAPEKHSFHPHVSLGKVRKLNLKSIPKVNFTPIGPQQIKEFHFLQSIFNNGQVFYKSLAQIKLATSTQLGESKCDA